MKGILFAGLYVKKKYNGWKYCSSSLLSQAEKYKIAEPSSSKLMTPL